MPTLSKHWPCAYGFKVRAPKKVVIFEQQSRFLQTWCPDLFQDVFLLILGVILGGFLAPKWSKKASTNTSGSNLRKH